MARWFRFYDDAVNNPKVQRLKPGLFRAWVNLLCVSSKHDGAITGDIEALAFTLRLPAAKVKAQIEALLAARLIDVTETGFTPHDWPLYQYDSDTSTERVKRFRERFKERKQPAEGNANGNVSTTDESEHGPVSRNVIEQNRAESDAETEQSRTEQSASPAAPPPTKRACRLSIEAIPDDWREFCKRERPDLDVDRTFANFRDHFMSSSGRNAVKLDWKAAWRLWVRREKPPPKASLFDPPPKPATVEEVDKWGRA